ncbi:MAG: chromosome segregation SMC family protein [Alkalispirochaeta sp.]
MFLKSIDLFGFKSFAERTHIAFTDGISALIGPNGCGKSNVVDAVKWVLGEQATKSLRAERMEDVIFNGTDSRKPVNVAEVTLTLHNDGVLPLEFPEITVKRRLFRSGDSEYFINGAPVKLKDLRELFYDTGIGKSAYSIMEQGKIDQILSTKPEDRRSLFEEAAGITRYKMRGREADRKLERTETNMHEVESVLSEVKRSYDSLKKQADKTTRYRELREQQFDHEVTLQLARLAQFRGQYEDHEQRVAALDQQRSVVKGEIDRLNEQLESELDRVNSMEGRLVEVQKRLYGLGVEKSSRKERITLIKEQREQLDDQIESQRGRLKALERKAEEIREAGSAASAAAVEAERQIAEVDQQISTIEDRIARAQERQREARAQIATNDETIVANEKEAEECQRELRTVTDELVSALDTKLRESGYSSAERKRAEEELTAALEHLRITVRGRRDSVLDRLKLREGQRGADDPDGVTATANAFGAVDDGLTQVVEAVSRYQERIPRFIDDFLAPEGTITRKRSLDDRIENLNEHNRRLREQNRELSREIEALQHTIEKERGNLEEMKLNRVQLQGSAASWKETAARHDREFEDNRRQSEEVGRHIERDIARGHSMDEQMSALHEEHAELEKQESALRTELKELEEKIAADNRSLKNEEQNLKQKMQDLAQLQEKLEEVQVRSAEKRTEIRGLYDSFSERHGRDLREFESRELSNDVDQKMLREQIATFRAELKELGSVNLMAVEEFAEVADRYEFLHSQLEDLRAARQDLVQVTTEIKRESEQLFVETYNRIRKNFHTVFRRLFGGGRAELRLTDPENILDSGIDILVQPPGKKLENIALLSGGERSLTAVALLFATFMVRPSPFTLLDEIDAALDEHNVSRFVNMLHEFGQQSQFIVITHNKKTVAGARTLLGVTMQENGVSQVVAVRIDGNGIEPDSEASDVPGAVEPALGFEDTE